MPSSTSPVTRPSLPGKTAAILAPEQRFAQNLVSESATIVIAIIFGLASVSLIVRGLPTIPIFEFYVYVLVFAWVGVLLPICIVGADVALTKHLPELVVHRPQSLRRVVLLSLTTTTGVSVLVLAASWLLFQTVALGLLGSFDLLAYLQLALVTLPLSALSTVIQGVYRGLQEMRFCVYATGFYNCLYFAAIATLYVLGTLTLVRVIWLNIVVSLLTIALEGIFLLRLLRRYGSLPAPCVRARFSTKLLVTTGAQALLLTILGGVFLNAPLLIANRQRTSEVLWAGLGLAVNIAAYMQRGQAGPFHALMPRVSGDLARGKRRPMQEYVNRAVKLGTLFNGFAVVIVIVYAAPLLSLLFGVEGLVAAPFFVLMAGSFAVYPLASTIMDTLIGIGGVRKVLLTYAAWTATICVILYLLCPLGRELVVALVWLAGVPFLLILTLVYERRSKFELDWSFLPKEALLLAGIGVLLVGTFIGVATLQANFASLGFSLLLVQLILLASLLPFLLLYVWLLARFHVLVKQDLVALSSISRVLHPLSFPVSALLKRLQRRATS